MPVVTTDAPWPDDEDDDAKGKGKEDQLDSLAAIDRLIDDEEAAEE